MRRTWLLLFFLLLPLLSVAGGFTPPQEIQAAAQAALAGQGAEVEASVDPTLRLAACAQPLQAVASGPRMVEVRCTDAPGWRVFVPVRVRREADVVVLTSPARAGVAIDPAQLAVQRRDLGASSGATFSSPDAVIGQSPRRSLPAGTVLTTADLVASTSLLRRGDPVVLVSKAGSIEVRVAGRALGPAAPGGVVAVENTESRRVIRGRLIGEGVVEVLR